MAYEKHHPEELSYAHSSASVSYGHSRLSEISIQPEEIPLNVVMDLQDQDVIALAGSVGDGGTGAIITNRLLSGLSRRPDLPRVLPDFVYGALSHKKRFQSALKNAFHMLNGQEMARKVDAMSTEASLTGTLRGMMGSDGNLNDAVAATLQPFKLLHMLSRTHTFALLEDLGKPFSAITTVVPIAGASGLELMLMEASEKMAGIYSVLDASTFIANTTALAQRNSIDMHICTINSAQ